LGELFADCCAGPFSVIAPMSERSPPAARISPVMSGVRAKVTPRASTNCSTRAEGAPA